MAKVEESKVLATGFETPEDDDYIYDESAYGLRGVGRY